MAATAIRFFYVHNSLKIKQKRTKKDANKLDNERKKLLLVPVNN